MKFSDYSFKPYILKGIEALNFTEPTAIQKMIIPKILQGQDIIGKSATGTGKTHAFLLPLLHRLDDDKKEVQAVIISPTRELAFQIYANCTHFTQFNPSIDIRLYVGGTNRDSEVKRLEKSQPQIVIGTIGKLKDLAIDQNLLKIHTTKCVVIDEADMVFESSEMETVDQIFARFSEQVQMLTFSATIPKDLIHFLNSYLNRCEVCDITERKISKNSIEHIFIPTKNKNKDDVLLSLLRMINPYLVLIFANTKSKVDEIALFLSENQIPIVKLTGDLESRERKQVLKRIKMGEVQYIVASDIASRGIDIVGVSHIINYEVPSDIEFYIHRSGRTARHEFEGTCYSLYDFDDSEYIEKLESKGLRCIYKSLSDDGLVNVKELNARIKRLKKPTKFEEELHYKIPVPKKVKPGYKKKRVEAIQKQVRKLKRQRIDTIYRKRNKQS